MEAGMIECGYPGRVLFCFDFFVVGGRDGSLNYINVLQYVCIRHYAIQKHKVGETNQLVEISTESLILIICSNF